MKKNHLWQLFLTAAESFPNELALIAIDRKISYQTLKQEVFYYTNYLHQQDVKPGDCIGILLPRNSKLIVAILSVLASGACYVPLDLRNPKERNKGILENSQCKYIISEEEQYADVKKLIFPNSERKEILSLPITYSDTDLAYIIHTSGSTGKPKGVMISHANACSLINWSLSVFSKKELSYTLAATSICFDLSIFEIFLPLAAGTCIVLVEHALSLLDNHYDCPISLINTVPSAIAALNKANAIPSSVCTINLAGEALQQSLVDELYKNENVTKIYNLYGPTETTTYSTYYLAQKAVNRIMVPIGYPIHGTNIYLLNQYQQPVPKLVRGEVYIGGEGVTQGYRNNPLETEKRFVSLKVGNQYVNLYRTGDLARINHAGELEYLGRQDQQIKIRGFRVEPEEIAHVLKQYSSIQQAYVKTDERIDAGEQLIAYFITTDHQPLKIDDLKIWLKTKLPDYMVPSYFVQLSAFPLNNNGKIDRSLLPLPTQHFYVALSEENNQIEKELIIIWKQLLPNKEIKKRDNFFYIGGHSLLAAKLQANIQETFKISFKLEDVFKYPSINEQANFINSKKHSQEDNTFISFTLLERPAEIPLSFSQQRLWYLQYAQSKPISNIPIIIQFKGELNLSALEKSFISLIERHEILRTIYQSTDNKVTQIIKNTFNFVINKIECEEETLSNLLAIEANKGFDLTSDLMIRVTLFKTLFGKNVLMVTQHHIASDAWSLNILMQELSIYYLAYHRGQALPILPKPIQYADYGYWQRQYFTEEKLQHDVLFWKENLEGAPASINLPYDRVRSELQTFEGAFHTFNVGSELTDKLKAVANQNQATLFITLLSAFNILLYRYSQQNDFCVGILSANRASTAFNHTLGFFVNTLTTRNQIESGLTIKQLISRVKDNVLACLAHQHIPFEKVVEALRPQHQANQHPLFQVLFSLQNALQHDLVLDGLELDIQEYDRKIAKFDLTLSLVEKETGLTAIFEYNTHLFNADTIARLASHYNQILTIISNEIDQTINEVDLLTTDERKQLLIDLNDVNMDYPHLSLADCFKQISQQFADKIALIANDQSYSYRQLDEESSQLANILLSYGVQQNNTIGLLLPRNKNHIVSVLAVIKTGASYVPIDPSWPVERIHHVLTDANISLIISLSDCLDNLPAFVNCQVLLLDLEQHAISQQTTTLPLITIKPEDPCYVMYTSGSTGQPKGVIALHQGVVRLVKNTNYIELNEAQTLLQVSQLIFDGATFDIWGSLLNGATLVLMPEGLPDLSVMADLIASHKVTALFITTQLFNALVDHKLSSLQSLKQLLFGGEIASHYHVEKFKNTYPQCMIRNIYGPTECTTYALSYLIPEVIDKTLPLPLGTPISNTSVVILTNDLQVAPIGVAGEICLGGPGLAKGYLNQEALTLEKFILNPIPEISSKYLYRTGDKGYYRADGQIVFIGRFDDQIKLRGYRIELAEIERVICRLEGIANAIVILQKPENILVAYIKTKPKISILSQIMRQQLATLLPTYMLPDAIEIVETYPLTVNGKIDKAKLPKHQFKHETRQTQMSSNDHLMTIIHTIWKDVLEDEEVTVEDNFFEVGGNSLKIVLILDKLQNQFKNNEEIYKKLDITTLFEYPTITSLAQYLQQQDENLLPNTARSINKNYRDKRKQINEKA